MTDISWVIQIVVYLINVPSSRYLISVSNLLAKNNENFPKILTDSFDGLTNILFCGNHVINEILSKARHRAIQNTISEHPWARIVDAETLAPITDKNFPLYSALAWCLSIVEWLHLCNCGQWQWGSNSPYKLRGMQPCLCLQFVKGRIFAIQAIGLVWENPPWWTFQGAKQTQIMSRPSRVWLVKVLKIQIDNQISRTHSQEGIRVYHKRSWVLSQWRHFC